VSKNLVIPTHLQTKVQGHYLSLVWMVNNNILINMTVTNTEKNGFISPDFVKSFISELFHTDRSRSLFDVNVMSKISQEICFVVVML
jgi:hypothetical protein